jgi:pimeloyl-ACP methyl ester carboxylesterase
VARVLPLSHGAEIDGFRLAYVRTGAGAPVVLLHGWPGTRRDWREVVPLLEGEADLVVPDLRGFGHSDRHARPPAEAYGADHQAASVLALVDELGLDRPVFVGYDVGSRVAQTIARRAPESVRAIVVSPPLPGVGERILEPDAQRQFWYQPFHALELSERLVDGDRPAVLAYLRHFWSAWSAPGWFLPEAELERLADSYAPPGAFTASIAWYRAGAGAVARALAETVPARDERIPVPTRVLWPERDPLFPVGWSDRLDSFFADVSLTALPGVGHFVPLEAPAAVAEAVRRVLAC